MSRALAPPAANAGDDLLTQFVRPDFDTGNFVRNAVRRETVSDDLAHLKQGIAVLESQLREQVVSHHGRLIEQVSHAKDLETMVTTVTAGVAKLQASLARVKSSIKEPYLQLQSKTIELDRLQCAGEMLRRIIRVDGKDPRSCINELTQGAGYVFEIESCVARGGEMADLSGVEEIERQRGWLQDMDSKIQGKAYEVLRDAVFKRQQAEIGSALQVFQQLEGLGGVVERLMSDVLKLAAAATRDALDTSALPSDDDPAGGKARSAAAAAVQQQRGPSKAHAAAWKATLWGRVDGLVEALSARGAQIWTLQRVLCKKRDAQTQQTYMEQVSPAYRGEGGDVRFFRSFWARLFTAVGKALQQAADQSTFVRGMLTQDLPRLRACLIEMHETWVRETEAGQAKAVGDAERAAMLHALEPFQTQHLAKVLTRLTDVADAVLGKAGAAANPAEAIALQKLVVSTAQAARGDEALSLMLAKNIQTALRHLVSRGREGIARDSDARVVGGHVTASHARNFALYNAALNVVSVEGEVGEGEAAREVLAGVQEEVYRLVDESVEPLFAGLEAALTDAVVSIHEGPLDAAPGGAGAGGEADGAGDEGEAECSLYMRRAAALVETYASKLAPRLQPSRCLQQRQAAAAERLLRLFVRHAVLVQPLGEMDKMRLVRDMTRLEEVAGRLAPLKDLGDGSAYAALRALRPLLFVEEAPLATLPARLAAAAAPGRLRRVDLLHAIVQRAAPYLPAPLPSAEPPSPARAQELGAYSAGIDADGGVAAVQRLRAELARAVQRAEGAGADGRGAEVLPLLRAVAAVADADGGA